MMASCETAAPRNSAVRAPARKTMTRSQPFDQLLKLRRDHQHAQAAFGQLVDQRLNLRLGADVDAARRLVEQQQRGLLQSQRASSTFC
jgi:hypothetical protein